MRYEGRIVGGNDVNRTTAPYQVSIRYLNKHFCGGSILNNRVIATAAHCNQFEIEKVSISYGSINVSTGQVVNVQFSYTHPNYNNITMENDVAVMILKEDIIFSDTARPIPLATQEPIKNTLLFVTGWGVLSQGGQTATILQGAYLMAVTRDSCKEAYYYTPYKITEDMICASIGGSDACQVSIETFKKVACIQSLEERSRHHI